MTNEQWEDSQQSQLSSDVECPPEAVSMIFTRSRAFKRCKVSPSANQGTFLMAARIMTVCTWETDVHSPISGSIAMSCLYIQSVLW